MNKSTSSKYKNPMSISYHKSSTKKSLQDNNSNRQIASNSLFDENPIVKYSINDRFCVRKKRFFIKDMEQKYKEGFKKKEFHDKKNELDGYFSRILRIDK